MSHHQSFLPASPKVTQVRRDAGVQLHLSQQSLLINGRFDSGGEIVPIYKVHSVFLTPRSLNALLRITNKLPRLIMPCFSLRVISSRCCHPHSPVPAADKGSRDYEGVESDLSFGLIHCAQTRSQFASSRLWLLASEHEREIYIDLSGCLH